MKKQHYLILGFVGLCLVGIYYFFIMSKEGPSFILQGEQPAQIKLQLKVRYEPNAGTDSCVSLRNIRKSKMYRYLETARQDTDGRYKLAIPTAITVEGCDLPIRSINIEALGKYGEEIRYGKKYDKEDGDRFAAGIGFFTLSDERLLDEQVTHYRSLCEWTFRIMPKGLIKILICKMPDEQWQLPADRFKQGKLRFYLARNQLAGQEITVDFRLNPEEKPYFNGSWDKTPTGWKRCAGDGDNRLIDYCDSAPGMYRTFEMDGKTCTVYPNCTE